MKKKLKISSNLFFEKIPQIVTHFIAGKNIGNADKKCPRSLGFWTLTAFSKALNDPSPGKGKFFCFNNSHNVSLLMDPSKWTWSST